jgi:hypothetical protein
VKPRPVGRTPEEQTQWERATRIARELTGGREAPRSVINAMFSLVQADEREQVPTVDLEAGRRAELREKMRRTAKASAREVITKKRNPRRRAQLDMFAGVTP